MRAVATWYRGRSNRTLHQSRECPVWRSSIVASPWENGYVVSFNEQLRDKLLNREVFDTLLEEKALIEVWRKEYNQSMTRKTNPTARTENGAAPLVQSLSLELAHDWGPVVADGCTSEFAYLEPKCAIVYDPPAHVPLRFCLTGPPYDSLARLRRMSRGATFWLDSLMGTKRSPGCSPLYISLFVS
jgi:hypothetical protein